MLKRRCVQIAGRPVVVGSRSPRETSRDDPAHVERLYQHEMLFTAANLPPDRRADILGCWLELLNSCPLGLNVLTDDIESPVGHVDTRLLFLARAIEAIHRRKYRVSDAAIRKHDERMAALRALVTKRSLWNWARGRLRRAYEPSLEERLRMMLKDVAPTVRQLIPDARFATAFARRRNAYARGSRLPSAGLRSPTDVYKW